MYLVSAVRIRSIVVERDARLCAELAELVMRSGLEVVARACDADTAIRQVRMLRPDIVVMDMSLRDDAGAHPTQVIRRALPDSKVVALSSQCELDWAIRAFDLGASAFVVKESARAELVKAIACVVSGASFVSACVDGASSFAYRPFR